MSEETTGKKQDWGSTLLVVLGVAALAFAAWMILSKPGKEKGDEARLPAASSSTVGKGTNASPSPQSAPKPNVPAAQPSAPGQPADKTSGAPGSELNPLVTMVTDAGELTIELHEDVAPNTVRNFVTLCDRKFYDGLTIHRRDGMCVQGGDPSGNGSGGPGYCIRLEPVGKNLEGCIAMARTPVPDSAGSQFYFVLNADAARHLDGQYCVFGKVVKGWDSVKSNFKIGTTIQSATVTRRRNHDYKPETLPMSAMPNAPGGR
jgi:peptidyl-prolyl cis-trans isomerase B (cyclophilin B)